MNPKLLFLLLLCISCNKSKENITTVPQQLPSKVQRPKIYWLKTPKYTIEIDSTISHHKGFECDSVIGIDYFGFEGEHFFYPINKEGQEVSTIKNRKKLTKLQFDKLNDILGSKETYKNPQIVSCYEPRLAFVYFKNNKVIGQTQICLSCAQLQSTVETINGEHGNCFNQKATDQLDQLRIELGFSKNPR